MTPDISVILPTYNEKDNILILIDEIEFALGNHNILYEIIVVDDNSPDGTGKIVREKYNSNPRIRIIIRENERGLATAIKTGILNSSGEFILVMDTDFNHDPRRIPLMYKLREDFDIIIGSRYVAGGGMEGSQFRYWGSYLFNVFIKLMLQMKTNDNLSGFFLTRKGLIDRINLDEMFKGYGNYFIKLLYYAKAMNLTILEIPVMYHERPYGESKTRFTKHTCDYFKTVIEIRLKNLVSQIKKHGNS